MINCSVARYDLNLRPSPEANCRIHSFTENAYSMRSDGLLARDKYRTKIHQGLVMTWKVQAPGTFVLFTSLLRASPSLLNDISDEEQ